MIHITKEDVWARAINLTMEMKEEEFEQLMELVKMNKDFHGLNELDALVIVLEQNGYSVA